MINLLYYIKMACQRFHRDQHGGAYTISYVMTMPAYVFMVMAFIEFSMLFSVKTGTVYSAFAAARTAAVWESIDPSMAQEKSQQSAVQTMTPFAAGMAGLKLKSTAEYANEEQYLAYFSENKAGTSASERYITAKLRYASIATRADIQTESTGSNPWEEDIVATVEYDYPFLFPMFGRMLFADQRHGTYVEAVSTTVRLQNEAPANPDKKLGISYGR